jgi:hypothetical protein
MRRWPCWVAVPYASGNWRALAAYGQRGDPRSPHFQEQAAMYARSEIKEVLLYPEQVEQHLERRYHSGKQEPAGSNRVERRAQVMAQVFDVFDAH